METYSNIWKALNQTTLKSLDEEMAHYPAEIEIDPQEIVKHFKRTSQYKFIDLASLSEEDEQFLESVGLSLNYLKLNQRKVITSEGVVQEIHRGPANFLELHLSMVEEGFIYAICPSTGKVLKSNRSFPLNDTCGSCCYRFVGKNVFYLILARPDTVFKHYLYFPRIDLIIFLFYRKGVPADKDQQIISSNLNFFKTHTVSLWQKLRLYLLGSDDAQTVIIVQHISILHYIKNMLSGIQKLIHNSYLENIDKFLVFGSEFYGDFNEIFPEISLEKVKRIEPSKDIFDEVIENNYFILRVLYMSCENTKQIMNGLYERIMSYSISKCSEVCLKEVEEAKEKCFPLLWINIRVHARVWLSQVEGTANILKSLYSTFPNLGVVFDGFTRQEVGGETVVNAKYEKVIKEENDLVSQIRSLLPQEIRVYNNIGCFMYESLVWAQAIDLSFETYGSSMTKTSIFDKPKLVHGPNNLTRNWKKTETLDGIIDANGGSLLKTDYDFDWKRAYEKLFQLASELTRDQKQYSQYSETAQMTFLSHRGFWKTKAQQNSLAAFKHSFEQGFGCELDIRTQNGQLVISHDLPTQPCLTLEELFKTYQQLKCDLPIAINIKADGLQQLLKQQIEKYAITNYFVFDMSIPDTLGYQKHQLKYFTRHSEYEPQPAFYEQAEGVWLDCFNSDWWTAEDIEKHLQHNKFVVLVSPELHKREYHQAWETWRRIERELNTDKLMLCTDFPQQAQEFFNDNH